MRVILHTACNLSSTETHESLNDIHNCARYLLAMNTTNEEIGKRLEAARKNAGLTRREVSERIPGLTGSTLSEWEKGRNRVNIDFVKQLAKLYGVTAGYLLTLEDAPQTMLESQVMYLLRQTDKRGQESVYRVAEAESAYTGRRDDEDQSRYGEPQKDCG